MSTAEQVESPIDIAALGDWMYERGVGAGPITNVHKLGGGTQNIVLRFTQAGRDYVLRRPPLHKRDGNDETMRREARILAALAGSAVPHPRLIAACADDRPLGAAFYLMEPVGGANPVEHPPEPGAQQAFGTSMIDALLALAAVDVDAAGLSDLGRRDGWLERQVPRWTRRLQKYAEAPGYTPPGGGAVTDEIAAWLDEHRPQIWQPGLVHGDYHIGNVMADPRTGRLTAIVDWELASIGDPLLDLGQLLVTWPTPGGAGLFDELPMLPTRGELIARYGAISGRDLGDLDWFYVLAGFRLGVVLEETYVRALSGKVARELGERFRVFTTNLFIAAHDRCY
jgi:aminoglycoside phosphotransferase (APT) family kinase protein